MAYPDVLPDAFLQFGDRAWWQFLVAEDGPVDVHARVPPRPSDHDGVPFFVPFQQGTRSDAELSAHLSRD
jgi:hypothetical protein